MLKSAVGPINSSKDKLNSEIILIFNPNSNTHLVAFVLDHLAREGAIIFSFGGLICVTNLLVYTSFHTHTQTHISIHTQKLVYFTMKSLKIKCCVELNLSFIFFYSEIPSVMMVTYVHF